MSDTGSLFAARGLRVFFACLVLAAGAGKAADLPGFIAVVESYRSLPAAAIAPAAWLLILTEFGLAAWLASGHRLRAAALATAGLHLLYLAWLAQALVRGLDIPNCGCFGVYWARPLTWWSTLEDMLLLGLAFVLWRCSGRRRGVSIDARVGDQT